jgi:Zn-dependent protease
LSINHYGLRFTLYALAALCLYLVVVFLLVIIQNWARILKPVRFEWLETLPAELLPLFDNPTNDLRHLGFERAGYIAVHNIAGMRTWAVLLYNALARSFALVELHSLPEPYTPFSVEFYTFLGNGELLLTLNGLKHLIIDTIPETILQDPYTTSLESQWQAHHDKLSQLSPVAGAQTLPADDFVQRLEEHYQVYIDRLAATQQVEWDQDLAQFYLKPLTVFKVSWQMIFGNRKAKALYKQKIAQAAQSQISPLDFPLTFEVEAYQLLSYYPRRQTGLPTKIGLVVVSLILFILSFLAFFELETLLIIIGVLLLHEMGHFIAMKIVGYQNVSLFFLPFMGAAVAGEKRNPALAERMLVLFAGPLPGLILGLGLFFLTINSAIFPRQPTLIGWLLILNYLNLLPLVPLDGGQIVDQLIFTDRAYLGALFKLFAVAIFILAGFWFGDFILFALALVVALTIRHAFEQAKMISKLKQYLPQYPLEETSAIAAVFNAIKQAGFAYLPFQAKYQLAKKTLEYRSTPGNRPHIRLAFIAFYGLCLFGTPLLFLSALSRLRLWW